MERIVVTLRPRNCLFVICRIGINAHHDLRPGSIAIIPGSISFAHARCRTVNWVEMHRGVHRWKRVAKTNMLSDRLIIYFVYKIGTPIPLQTRGIQRVEHTLQRRLRQRTYKIEGGLLESTNGLKCFFGFGEWTSICPDDSTHFFHVKMLGKRGRWRHSEKSKEPTQIIGSCRNQIAIPFHHLCCFAYLI